jgi:predicted esterase
MLLKISSCLLLVLMSSLQAAHLNLLENPGFESKTIASWAEFDSSRIQWYGSGGHSGKSSLLFIPLKEAAGIDIDLSNILKPGYRYRFRGWFRNFEAGWGQVDVLLIYRQDGNRAQINIGRVDCNKDTWTNLTNEFHIPQKVEPSEMRLAIRAAWGQIAFLVDDLELRPALHLQLVRDTPSSEPDVIATMGPQTKQREHLKVQFKIFDQANHFLKQYTQQLYKPLQEIMAPGFYRLEAVLNDIDSQRFESEKIYNYGNFVSLTTNLDNQVQLLISDPSFTKYHGWIKYLNFLALVARQRTGTESDRSMSALYRLNQWVTAIQNNPAILDTLSGVLEWAYLSRVDDSGQPFKLAIPSGYTADKNYPLVVVMHGYGGNHMEYSGGVRSNPDYFELHVLGRARGGQYICLSEGDVLDAVDYVCKNWRIDDRRIHLTGASMGGGGTFKLMARYPQRWASGRPVCGFGLNTPVLNGIHVPVYSTHSMDDPTVPVLASRAPLRKLLQAGGKVIIDETSGLQHAAWNYTEGNNRGLQWMQDQVRPLLREVRQIDYTALDRETSGAYWLKIVEWGERPGPARFKVTADQNQLYVTLENIRTLQIAIGDSPLDPAQDLDVSVNGNIFFTFNAPLADSVFITTREGAWIGVMQPPDKPGFLLHTPGGVHNLYHREPLLIVYGSAGDSIARQAMALAAQAAAKSVNSMWVGDEGDIKEGVANHQLLYGYLNIKPDTAVTGSDMEKCHLLLIGKAEENSLVKRMQDQLPVRFDKTIICSDGFKIPADKSVMGLYFYNPLSPQKLIYWVAADTPIAYHPYSLLFQLQSQNPCGTDMLIVQDTPPRIVKARHFDSRWNWSDTFGNAGFITNDENTYGEYIRRVAEATRKITGSDFALQAITVPPEFQVGIPGITRWSDIAALDFTTPVAVLEMKGTELLRHQEAFSAENPAMRFYPVADKHIEPDRIYRVAMTADYTQIQALLNILHQVPESFIITDLTLFEIIKGFLF